jgi:transcriptional regulator with XRE-family HTH domain
VVEALRPTARRAPRDGSNLAAVIQAYMRTHAISTTADVAAILGVDRTLVSKYLNGSRSCHDVAQLRHYAEAMDLPPETFGLVAVPNRDIRCGRDPVQRADAPIR